MDILFLCDLHINRPWVRDRVEGLKYAISEVNLDVQLIDIYDFCGIEGRKIREHKNRNLRLINMDADKANRTILKNVAVAIIEKITAVMVAVSLKHNINPEKVSSR